MGTEDGQSPVAAAPAEGLLARGFAPIKAAYLRPESERVHVASVQGSQGAAPVEAGTQISKRQARKEKGQAKRSTAELCSAFMQGTCRFGEGCRFNHDVEAFLSARQPELPGSCPFAMLDSCPFGISCRWASKHPQPDQLTREFLLKHDSEGAALAGQGSSAARADEPANGVNTKQGTPPGAEKDGAEPPTNGVAPAPDGDATGQGLWRRDGTIPTGILPMHAEPSFQKAVNILDKVVQNSLWQRRYDFSRADAVLASMGLHNSQAKRGASGPSKGGKRARAGEDRLMPSAPGAEGGAEAATAASVPLPGADEGANERGDAVAASVPLPGADEGANERGDAAPPAAAEGSAPAQHAAPAAGSAGADPGAPLPAQPAAHAVGADGLEYAETAQHPREKRRLDFGGKLYLAPLTTVGNLPFRRLAKRLGADVTCGEMAMATNLLQGQAQEWALLKRHPDEDCFGVQLCGGFPDALTRCAQLINDRAAVDFVDINFGCPIDVVCSKGAGSACLLRPARLEQIVRAASSVLDCALTFKTRTGYHDGRPVAHEFVPGAGAWGACAVTLHGRSREQRYSRPADWDYIGRCAAAPRDGPLQIIGNGDVMGWQDHYRHMEEGGGSLATTYIARGALVKPWIFTEIKERRDWDISAGERLDLIRQFCSFGLEHWGSDARGVETTRRFLLEWLSFQHRYIPVGLLEVLPQRMDWRRPAFAGRSDLETLLASDNATDWVRISEMLLGPAPQGFTFTPKHKANAFSKRQDAGLTVSHGEEAQENG